MSTQLLEKAGPSTKTRRMSFEEYLVWEHEGGLAEWVDGEVTIMAVTEMHQRILQFLFVLLDSFVRIHQLGRIMTAPYAMRATPDGPGREPDLMFVTTANLMRLEETHLNGPADLVIEIVSDESVGRDRTDKFSEYQDAGVREYWIIDPRPRRWRADFYVLNRRGHFQSVAVDDDGIYRSLVLSNFWLKMDWLVGQNLDATAALIEIVGMEPYIKFIKNKYS